MPLWYLELAESAVPLAEPKRLIKFNGRSRLSEQYRLGTVRSGLLEERGDEAVCLPDVPRLGCEHMSLKPNRGRERTSAA